MARPVNADAEETRARILATAAALFSERGIDGTSVRDVAGGAGVSLAMVGHYFGSKDDLYDACVGAMYAELAAMKDELWRELSGDAPLDALFSRAVVVAFRFARAHQTAVRLLVRAAVSTGELHPQGKKLLFEALDVVTRAVGARLGRPPGELRLPLQSVVFLVARYAAQSERELSVVAGVPVKEKRQAVEAVEAHLVGLTMDLFGLRSAARERGAR